MDQNLNLIFDRFKESYSSVKDSNFSQHNIPMYLENLKLDNTSLVRQLYGEKGVKKFEKLIRKEIQ
jgi:hypothetical protein